MSEADHGQAVIGLDIGGGSTKAALFVDGEPMGDAVSERYAMPDRAQMVKAIRGAIVGLGAIEGREVAVGACVPGILDASAERVELAVNLPGLMGLDVRGVADEALGGRLCGWSLTSDALAATYAHWSIERRPGRLLALVLGTGVGACVLDDDVPLIVVDNCPGHLGQMDVGSFDGGAAPIGPDGGAGSLEAYVGSAAVRARFGTAGVLALLKAPSEDPFYRALARALRIAHAVYRPHAMVLLGGIGTRLRPRLADLRELVMSELTGVAREGFTIECGGADELGARGAALLAMRGGGR